MDYDNYINELFTKYIYNIIFDNNCDSFFSEYNDIIAKDNDNYVNIGNSVKQEILSENQANILKKYYQNNVLELNDEVNKIFDLYLTKIISTFKRQYYFKINDNDINPDNVVDTNTIVLIIRIRLNYNIDFNLFLKKYSGLKLLCKEIENKIMIEKNIKIRFLFDMVSNINTEKKEKME